MHRQPLLNMLKRYLLLHPEEASVVQEIEQLVTSATDCFERTCRPGHITGSGLGTFLRPQTLFVLLVHHRKLNRWLQPGGHADGEHNIAEVALREVREETGLTQIQLSHSTDSLLPLDIDVHLIPARRDSAGNITEDAHQHHDIRFLVIADSSDNLIVSDESHDVRWFTYEEILQTTDEESVLRMLRKAGPFPAE